MFTSAENRNILAAAELALRDAVIASAAATDIEVARQAYVIAAVRCEEDRLERAHAEKVARLARKPAWRGVSPAECIVIAADMDRRSDGIIAKARLMRARDVEAADPESAAYLVVFAAGAAVFHNN